MKRMRRLVAMAAVLAVVMQWTPADGQTGQDLALQWRQALASAPPSTSAAGRLYDRPLSTFVGVVLVPPTRTFSGLRAGVRTTSSDSGSYLIQVGDFEVFGTTGRGYYDAAAERDQACEGTSVYCAQRLDGGHAVERFFRGITARGQSAAASHWVFADRGQAWYVFWYSPEANVSYSFSLFGGAAEGVGAPARLGEDNLAYARAVGELANSLIAVYPEQPTIADGPLPQVLARRDAGALAIAGRDRAALLLAINELEVLVAALGAPPAADDPPEAAAYQRTTREWAELLLGGAWQVWAELWLQEAQALAGAADYPTLERALAEAEAQLARLQTVTPASLLAGWYQQAVANLAAQIGLGRAIAAGLTTVEDASALGWGVVPVFPALSDFPIDGGLLPVPQQFQVIDATTGQAYYNVPPNALWGVGKAVGPSCGLYPSPYGATRGIVRWGTYGYSGCVNPGPPGGAAQFEAAGGAGGTGSTGATAGGAGAGATGGGRGAPPVALQQGPQLPAGCGNLDAATIRSLQDQARRSIQALQASLGTVVGYDDEVRAKIAQYQQWVAEGDACLARLQPTATRVPPTPTARPLPTSTPATAWRGPLPSFSASTTACGYGGNIFGTSGPSHNAVTEVQGAWTGPASNAEINALIDEGIAGLRQVMAARTRAGYTNTNEQRCIDYLNSVRP